MSENRMTEPDPQRKLRDIVQNDRTFWMVACEWTEFHQEQAIATSQNPNAQGRIFSRRMTANEVTNTHPLVYGATERRVRAGFTVMWAMVIEKELYDWVMANQQPAEQPAEPSNNSGIVT